MLAAILFAAATHAAVGFDRQHGVATVNGDHLPAAQVDVDRAAAAFSQWLNEAGSGAAAQVCAGVQIMIPTETIEPYATLRARELEICSHIAVTEADRVNARITYAPPPPPMTFPEGMSQPDRDACGSPPSSTRFSTKRRRSHRRTAVPKPIR